MVDAMLMGEQSTYVDLLYHPIGFDLGKNTGFAWADAWVSWPIIRWLGTPQFLSPSLATHNSTLQWEVRHCYYENAVSLFCWRSPYRP